MSEVEITPFHGEENHAERQSIDVARLFEVLLESFDDGILVFDRSLRVVFMNAMAERLTGHGRSDILEGSECCGQFLGCQDQFGQTLDHLNACPVRQLLSAKRPQPIERELFIRNKAGMDVWLRNRYFPVIGPDGSTDYVICNLRDTSEHKAMEEQLLESRKLATFGVLTAGIAHELKNPLGILRSAAEIITNPERNEAERLEAAEFVKAETMRLDRIIKQFLAYARPNPPELVDTDLNEVADHTAEIFLARDGRPAGIRIEKRFAPGSLRCWIDAAQIHQVLLNLLLNAEEAVGNQGTVVISTDAAEPDWVSFEVADNGPGIASNQIERVFDPFFTTKSEGSGLGLAVVRRIVTEHYGRIRVDQSPLGGAAVTIRLPRHPSGRPIPVEIDPSIAPIGAGGKLGWRPRKSERGKQNAQAKNPDRG